MGTTINRHGANAPEEAGTSSSPSITSACTRRRIFGFKVPCAVEELNAAAIELLKRQGFLEAYVRPIAWRGSEMMDLSAKATASPW